MAHKSKPERAPSSVERCYRIIRKSIVSCDLAPGAKIGERDLMMQTGFGRTPVREALLRLVQDGLIITLPRSGYQVTPLTENTINEIYELWCELGPLAARLGFARISAAGRADIAALDRPAEYYRNLTPNAVGVHAAQFFRILVREAENAHLEHALQRLEGDLERIFTLFYSDEAGHKWLARINDMTRLSQCTNPDEAASEVWTHIMVSKEGVEAIVRARALARKAAAQEH